VKIGFSRVRQKNKKYYFRMIRPKSSLVGATTDIGFSSDFTTRQ
jgi:hypothetical protein